MLKFSLVTWIIFLPSLRKEALLLSIEKVEYIVVFWSGDTFDFDLSLDRLDF